MIYGQGQWLNITVSQVANSIVLVLSRAQRSARFFAWQRFYRVQAASGWSVNVVYRDVPKAATLALLSNGSLRVSHVGADAELTQLSRCH